MQQSSTSRHGSNGCPFITVTATRGITDERREDPVDGLSCALAGDLAGERLKGAGSAPEAP